MDSVSLSHHTVVEIAAKIPEPSMQFPQYNCRVLYPRVSILYETEDWFDQVLNLLLPFPITVDPDQGAHIYALGLREAGLLDHVT
jgi:hypothetical protein